MVAIELKSPDIIVENLRCEYSFNPLGVDVACPRFSWTVESSQRGEKQEAYQVLVATRNEKQDRGDAWDSGKVEPLRP